MTNHYHLLLQTPREPLRFGRPALEVFNGGPALAADVEEVRRAYGGCKLDRVDDVDAGSSQTVSGKALREGLAVRVRPGKSLRLMVAPKGPGR